MNNMLKTVLKKTYLTLYKVKILHSIPGRIRFFIPALDKMPEQLRKYEDYISGILKLKEGINKIEYSYLTSKILLEYDKDKLTESDIVEWLNKIWKVIVNNEHIYQGMSVEEIEKNVIKFYNMLSEKLKKGEINK